MTLRSAAGASCLRRWSAVAVAAALLALVQTAGHAETADRIARQRSQIEATHARIRAKRGQLGFEERRERSFRQQLAETSATIATVEARLGDLQQRIAGDRAQEARQQRRLDAAVVALRRQRDAYDRRLVEMYEQPPQNQWSVLVGAHSFADLAERWDDLRYVVAQDQRDVTARDAAVHRVNALRNVLAESLLRLRSEDDRQLQEREQLGGLAQERANLVAVTDRQRASVAGEVTQLEDISAEEEAQLEALIREQQAELERERAQGRAAVLLPPRTGEMQWPLAGRISSPFGWRLNPFGGGNTEFHPGIDIAVDLGTPVEAAAPGRVIIAGWVSGYGNYVAIDHGGGISTGYGHLSQIYVSVGQDVQRGQAIGASGSTGRSTGPHLIFEVRIHGTPVDPMPYLR